MNVRQTLAVMLFLVMGLWAIASPAVAEDPAAQVDVAADGVIEVAAEDHSEYGSLQKVIDAAPAGSTVRLGPGQFPGSLTIDKSLTIVGAGWDKTWLVGRFYRFFDHEKMPEELRERAAEYKKFAEEHDNLDGEMYEAFMISMYLELGPHPALTIKKAEGVVVQGLSVSLPGAVQKGGGADVPAIYLTDCEAKFTDCALLGSAAGGLKVDSGASAEIRSCLFAGITFSGVEIRRTRTKRREPLAADAGPVKIVDCDFRVFGYSGILVSEGAIGVEISRCRVSQASFHGIYYHDASPTISDCWVYGNTRSGIYVRGKTNATLRNNVLLDGSFIAHEATTDTLVRNTFTGTALPEPSRSCVRTLAGSKLTLRKNVFLGTKWGVATAWSEELKEDRSTEPGVATLEGNLFWDNAHDYTASVYAKREGDQPGETVVEDLDLPPSNLHEDPGLDDFLPQKGSAAERLQVGAKPVISMKSSWPPQPEEAQLIENLGLGR